MVDNQSNKPSFIGRFRAGGDFGGLAEILFAPKEGNPLSKNESYTSKLIDETNRQIENSNGRSSNIVSDLWKKIKDLFAKRRRELNIKF